METDNALYIVYAGYNNYPQGQVSKNCQGDLDKALRAFAHCKLDSHFDYVFINKTIPGQPDEIILRYQKDNQ